MLSTIEPQHKEELLLRKIIPELQQHRNLLDIGTGRGDFTQIIGKYFNNITAVDNSEEALNNLPSFIGLSPVHKVKGSILDCNLNIYNIKYDMILISHTIYYIPQEERLPLIEDMTQLLSKTGVLVLVFNDEGDRASLGKHYGAIDSGFSSIHNTLPQLHNNFQLYRIDEFLDGGDLNSMMHIAGICLNDYEVNATKESLSSYLTENYCPNNICQLSMTQNIMVIGQDESY
ncbi:MAG: class I SAM-dependent methyltransferase [Rickettsiales bacterium]|jgi:SAM-dependent methyltransferase|nr:class I SAM-dependent methyltransferase [Rickettsiales bacterium]